MTNRQKARGDAAEREAAELLSGLLGLGVRRKLGAGRLDDVGDLDGIPGAVVQVAYRPSDTLRAVVEKPEEVERQREVAGADYAITMLRMRGGRWRVVLTVEQAAALLRRALQGSGK